MNSNLPNEFDVRESILETLKNIDTEDIPEFSENEREVTSSIVEPQKIFFWIRLYLKEEYSILDPGDDITIKWLISGEELKSKFLCYDKNIMNSNYDHISLFEKEDNKKILCLMVNIDDVNNNEDIPFIRTLFKIGIHYEYQLVKNSDLNFIIEKNNEILEYFDVDF